MYKAIQRHIPEERIFNFQSRKNLRPHTEAMGVKLPVREPNHSPSSGADIKNTWSKTSRPPLLRHELVLNLIQGQF
jgi:hypothetical protein